MQAKIPGNATVSPCHPFFWHCLLQSGGVYKLLGTVPSLAGCNAKAAAWVNATEPTQRCLSTCWLKAPRNSSNAQACYCAVSPTWMPLPSTEVDSAVVQYPCAGPGDCSYNGKCGADGSCSCDAAWGGVRCGELQLLPVDRKAAGFREINTSDDTSAKNVSTWGAPMLWDEPSAQWHGWASEMTHGCGINAWETNSQIVHIVGDSPQGPFQRKEVFAPPFAHEPDVVRGPKGEWVMLYSGFNAVTRSLGLRGYNESALAAAICTNCSNGFTPPQGTKGCPFQRGTPRNLGHPFIQMMAIAETPDGPWKQQVGAPQAALLPTRPPAGRASNPPDLAVLASYPAIQPPSHPQQRCVFHLPAC